MSVIDKFLNYVSYDTQSDDNSNSVPSTAKQLNLGKQLEKECKEIGASNVHMDASGNVYATIEANCLTKPSIGFLAHMDTATELSGANVKPRIIKDYAGETIQLNEQYSMNPKDFPNLNKCLHTDLIVTDGNTLLGADDKAGIAIIMQAMEEIIQTNPEHGKIMFAFTVDEEIGRGTDHFNLEDFKVDFAYTVDGADVDHIDYETFNAAGANIQIFGTSIHPGEAKGKMVNASSLAAEFILSMPKDETPECTEGYEGFYHLTNMNSSVDFAQLHYIIRDHSKEKFEERKQFMMDQVKTFNEKYKDRLTVNMYDSYYNMSQFITDSSCIDKAMAAISKEGLHAQSEPVRGGTDGARLTELGLVCPNLGTGSFNHHGRFEFASIQQMETMVKIVKNIILD